MQGIFTLGTGTSSSTINTFLQTTWSTGNEPGLAEVARVIGSFFANNGGVQNLRSFNPGYQGIFDIAALVGVGANSVLRMQTGSTIAGNFAPQEPDMLPILLPLIRAPLPAQFLQQRK